MLRDKYAETDDREIVNIGLYHHKATCANAMQCSLLLVHRLSSLGAAHDLPPLRHHVREQNIRTCRRVLASAHRFSSIMRHTLFPLSKLQQRQEQRHQHTRDINKQHQFQYPLPRGIPPLRGLDSLIHQPTL